MLGSGQLALLLEFSIRAKAQVCLALSQKPLSVLPIN